MFFLLNESRVTGIGDGDFVLFCFFVCLFEFFLLLGLSEQISFLVVFYFLEAEIPKFCLLDFILERVDLLFKSKIFFDSGGE